MNLLIRLLSASPKLARAFRDFSFGIGAWIAIFVGQANLERFQNWLWGTQQEQDKIMQQLLLPWLPSRSTPMRSIRGSLRFSRGSYSMPSGVIAPSGGSTSATAIGSMIARLATIGVAKFVAVVTV
jgi:hypothetical protein